MRRALALVTAVALLAGCGGSSGGAGTTHQYKPNSNQNPDNEAH